MRDVFISHAQGDTAIALRIALFLERHCYSTWCYQVDSLPGPSYLVQTAMAIESSQAVVVLITPQSIDSRQVTKEVVRAHESGKHFIPLLCDISYGDFQQRQPEWREALGAATSLRLRRENLDGELGRVIEGLRALGVRASTAPQNERITILATALEELRTHSGHDPTHGTLKHAGGAVVHLTQEESGLITLRLREDRRPECTLRFDSARDRRIIIGRGEGCDVRVYCPTVSRKHAMIWLKNHRQWELKDLGSTQGTRLNGRPIEGAVLQSGDVITVGTAELVVGELIP